MTTDIQQVDGGAQVEEILTAVSSIAAEHLRRSDDREVPVYPADSADEIREMLRILPGEEGRPLTDMLDELRTVLAASVRTTHPRFANQLFVGADLSGMIGEWLTAVLDTTMATFEMAPVATVMERALIGKMCRLAGFDSGEGILTPGGSISNLMAVLVARNRAYPRARVEGMAAKKPPALFASEEAHYSIRRAANALGLGVGSVRPVAVDDVGRLRPEALRREISAAKKEERRPFFVCATAGTTVAGAYDPIDAIADICAEEQLWLHVDGAYGGAALLSDEHRELMEGCQRADSITWCPHKMMGLPLITSALLMRNAGLLAQSLSVEADYIFHDTPEATDDLGNMSLQCGRRVDALKLWLAWQVRGDDGYRQLIDRFFGMAEKFAARIRRRDSFQLVRRPQSCNVLFHYLPREIREIPDGSERREILDELTPEIRERVKQRGKVMVNFAPVDGVATFRMVLINPRMEPEDMDAFLDEIESVGRQIDIDRLR